MEKTKITFLGTSNAIPTAKRNHSAILLNYKNENILIDCGEGTQRQFKIAKISPSKLTKILITHWHGDHTLGLLGLIETLIMTKYNKQLQIYGPRGTKEYFNLLTKFLSPYHRLHRMNFYIEEVQGIFSEQKEFYFEAKQMLHGIPTNAYSFIIKDKRKLLKEKLKKFNLPNSSIIAKLQQGKTISFNGKKISPTQISKIERGRKITFIMDTAINQNAFNIAKNSDLLICESTFSENEKEMAKEYKHLTSTDAATIAKKSKSKRLILTHISERYESELSKILNEAKKVFKNTSLANDFDVVEF